VKIDASNWKNKLYFGDNLQVLRENVPTESVDLIYLDLPFNSQATYNVLFGEKNSSQSQAQIKAFEDTWHWGEESQNVYEELIQRSDKLSDLIEALYRFLGANDMMAYIVMMAIRLAELHRVLKRTGSIYIHCDPTASHYLKILMDAVFDPRNFRNEIIWCRSMPKAHVSRRFPSGHDVILFYGKSESTKFSMIFLAHDENYLGTHYRYIEAETGRRYDLTDLTNPNRNRPHLTYEFPPGSGTVKVWRWTKDRMMEAWEKGQVVVPQKGGIARFKRYLDEQRGTPCGTVWTDIPPINSQAKERLGYPTQKPEDLLERIISASSKEGDLVLAPFCGCGTSIAVAERLQRRWIGVDITYLAITLVRSRLESAFADETAGSVDKETGRATTIIHTLDYEVIGDPKDLSGAKALSEQDRHQFELWIVGKLGGRPSKETKKGADSGIDGRIKFFDDVSGKPKTILIQVKSGHVGVSQIRDLVGVLKREKAAIGVFVTLAPPTRPMILGALAEGYYAPLEIGGYPAESRKVPRVQIITVRDILDGASIRFPAAALDTFKKAERKYKEKAPEQNNWVDD
jgi:site-specific DNA-methyltransferase (adenine-specific)